MAQTQMQLLHLDEPCFVVVVVLIVVVKFLDSGVVVFKTILLLFSEIDEEWDINTCSTSMK